LGPGDRFSWGVIFPESGPAACPASQPTVRSGAGRLGAVHRAGHPGASSRDPDRPGTLGGVFLAATASAGFWSSISGSPTRNWASCLAAT
jgi:hypothetical protein